MTVFAAAVLRRRPHPLLIVAVFAVIVGWHIGLAEAGHLEYLGRINWFEVMGPAYLFAAAGFLAWHRQPDLRTGKLMVGYGLLTLPGTLEQGSRVPLLWTFASLVNWLAPTLLIYILLTFPRDQRLTKPARVSVAIAAAATSVTMGPVLLPFYNPTVAGCPDCQPGLNLLLFWDHYHVVWVGNLGFANCAVIVGLLYLLGILAVRFVRAGRPERRVIAPLYVAVLAWSLAISYLSLYQAVRVAFGVNIWLFGSSLFQTVLQHVIFDSILAMPLALLFGFWLAGRRQRRVGAMVVALGDLPERRHLEDVVRRTLGDSRARVGFRTMSGDYVSADGEPLELPTTSSGLATTYLESAGEPRAVIVHDVVLLQEPELLRSVAAAARLAVDNDRLQAEVRAQLEEVRASRARLVAAADDARRQVERDLHDGAQQRLLALGLALKRAQRRVSEDTEVAQAIMDEAAAELDGALDELRELARGIHPAILSEQGLVPAVRMLAERSEVPVRVESLNGLPRPPATVESTAYFVVAEALTNVAKHASATAAKVHLEQQPDRLIVRVEDDGVGGADAARGSGLLGLQDRVAAAGGHLLVESISEQGTRIVAELPCG